VAITEFYEFQATSYRECIDPDCGAHQHWVCAIDRWSEPFDSLSPRLRDQRRRQDLADPKSATMR
jgi:hypothetical protein